MELSLETYRQIIKNVDSLADICSLCRVSKGFQRAAEAVLYHALHMQNAEATFSLCHTLADQPRLSALVKALTIDLSDPEYSDEGVDGDDGAEVSPPPGFWEWVARALRSTVHLLYLDIYGGDAAAWILNGTTFRLRVFHCDLEWNHDLVSFLSTQSDLADLHIADYAPATAPPLDVRCMPNLSIVECTFPEAAGALVPGRPVTHLKTCFARTGIAEKRAEMGALFAQVRLSTRPFSALDIADTTYTDAFGLELLGAVIHALPTGNLRYLGTMALPKGGRQRLQFYGLLMRIPRLECLEVDVTDWVPQPTRQPRALCALARELRLYLPSIVRVVFVNEFDRTVIAVVDGWCVLEQGVDTRRLWSDV